MMCGVRVPWIVEHSNNNEAVAGLCKVSVDFIIAIIIIKNELFLKKLISHLFWAEIAEPMFCDMKWSLKYQLGIIECFVPL